MLEICLHFPDDEEKKGNLESKLRCNHPQLERKEKQKIWVAKMERMRGFNGFFQSIEHILFITIHGKLEVEDSLFQFVHFLKWRLRVGV